MQDYQQFLESKIQLAPKTGFRIDPSRVHSYLKPHQKDVVIWNCSGGCRADFLNFGLGKTLVQLETARQIILDNPQDKVLFVCPLSVREEFDSDGLKVGVDRIDYITTTGQKLGINHIESIDSTNSLPDGQSYFITNYERIRKGQIDPACFKAVFFDEASVLRNLDTDTTQTILETFSQVEYRFVSTATPAPNEYLEFINYAEYLGIMDRGQALTRFFKRDSTTAGNLTLLERREKEFWHWMSSWAVFLVKPSDLGYSDEGYELPPLEIVSHRIVRQRDVKVDNRTGQTSLEADASKSLPDAAREKQESIGQRVEKVAEIIAQSPEDHFIVWHHLEPERKAIQKALGSDCKSVYGSQKVDEREEFIRGFKTGKYRIVSTKPEICGSGVNWQYHCHRAIFAGINYKFNDFLQALHRNYRFLQTRDVRCDIIYTDAEEEIYKELMRKWDDHKKAQFEMTTIIKKHGLNADLKPLLSREMFQGRKEARGQNWVSVNNDSVLEWANLPDNCHDLLVTSIPFETQYEYGTAYNDLGHNESVERFFEQMDYLVPNLYRCLKPGRVACVHVKDSINYSYENGTGFSSIDPFSDHTTACFRKHGFHLIARITVDTDVVRENASSYRLGWTEACKDMTKMGSGQPEYILVLRKAPTSSKNAYADEPVWHKKRFWDKKKRVWTASYEEGYSRGRWQLDAHAHWKTDGNRLLSEEQLRRLNHKDLLKLWKELEFSGRYDYHRHAQICELLDKVGKLPSGFMCLPPQSNHEDIWDDVARMRTLNSAQVTLKTVKHICPLQLDIIERCIERYSNPGELVVDPFAGIASTGVEAVRMGRKAFLCELNPPYWKDGQLHLRGVEAKAKTLTLDFGEPNINADLAPQMSG